MNCKSLIAWSVGSLLLVAGAAAQEAGKTSLTIYSTAESGAVPPEVYRPVSGSPDYPSFQASNLPGYATVRQERELAIDKGRGTLRFTDVAALIDPTTVSFASLSDTAGTRVIEQNFQFDLVSNDRLLQRFIDKPIRVEQAHGDTLTSVAGTLLSTSGGLILRDEQGGVQILNGYSGVKLPELPGGLITRPTLVWDIVSDKGGTQRVRVSYETGGMTWWTDYNLTFAEGKNANSGTLDLGAWVSIINQSGSGYTEAGLKLVAGKLHRAPRQASSMARMKGVTAMAMEGDMSGFQEKGFFEYHLYTLGRPTTLPDNSTKQIELFPVVRGVPCDKVLVYYGAAAGMPYGLSDPISDRDFGTQSNKEVDTYLRFKNRKEDGLGMALPGGRIRVSKLDSADGSLELIGEDSIRHTPKDEMVLIKLGTAFDVVGERTQTDFQLDTARRTIEEEIEIKVRNHKDTAVTVIVKENLYRWSTWEIVQKSHDVEKIDARTVHFPVQVAKDGEVSVTYRVRYTW